MQSVAGKQCQGRRIVACADLAARRIAAGELEICKYCDRSRGNTREAAHSGDAGFERQFGKRKLDPKKKTPTTASLDKLSHTNPATIALAVLALRAAVLERLLLSGSAPARDARFFPMRFIVPAVLSRS